MSEIIGRYFTTAEAALYLAVSPRTLEHWRLNGRGPVYHRLGERAVRYTVGDLDDPRWRKRGRHTGEA